MISYSLDVAEEELSELGVEIIRRADKLADSYNMVELAKLIVLVNKEIYRTDEEARKLRLTGQLNVDVYQGIVRGYRTILDQIFGITERNSIANEVRILYKALKFSNELAGTYLAEYLREFDDGGNVKHLSSREDEREVIELQK